MEVEDDVNACLMECSADLTMPWFHSKEMVDSYPEEYNHLNQLTSLCIPIRSQPELNVVAVLQIDDQLFQNNTSSNFQKRIISFTRHMSGPLELVMRIETNQILAMRRFNGRVAHMKLLKTFQGWSTYHQQLVKGREARHKKVIWMEKLKKKHKSTNEYHILVAWTRFVSQSRGEKIRSYQIELNDLKREKMEMEGDTDSI
jgi:hypothetical protein